MQRDRVLAGRYRLLERLGSGGMSAVHRAYDEVLERDVAVKVLVVSGAHGRRRIRAEAKAAARLSHPHVTNVYDYGESPLDGVLVPFVVLELLDGHTLEQRLDAGPLPPRAGLRVCAEVASALAAAHAQGLVHRDIKPGNVMLTPDGAKMLDFGIAAAIGDPEIDFEGRLLGTPAYLAPERLAAGEVLPASDVYALGLLLHRVLTGRLPWAAEAQVGMLRASEHVEPDPLPDIDGVPAEVQRLYRWCLAHDPTDRPPATEAARILLVASGAVDPVSGVVGTAVSAAQPASTTAAQGGDSAEPERAAAAESGGRVEPGGRQGAWRRRRAILAVGGALMAAVAMAGPLGDSNNRRQGQDAPPTGVGPGTTSVGFPRTAESAAATDPRPSAAPSARDTSPVPRPGPPSRPGRTSTPSPTATIPGPAPTGAASPPSSSSGVPVEARGGTVTVRCVGKLVEVLAVTPAPGYRAETYDPGPAKQVRLGLGSAGNRSEIRAHCPSGRPKSTVKERAS
ncbi:serine/threonine-protein kinase [Micromonospora profundi]|uniref:serine/threonine-protein kinase n=1 Tax=Micromonospora profundi TaxID=1420889 RepID=UPI0033A3E020